MTTSATGSRSFTFLELTIIILITGILVGVSVPTLKRNFMASQIKSFSLDMQAHMNYLRERAIVEGKVISLNVDLDNHEYWAQLQTGNASEENLSQRLMTYRIPQDIKIETNESAILFFPDGNIQKTTLNITGPGDEHAVLTTEGVFGNIKISQ